MLSALELKHLLSIHGIRPAKGLGQHFLVSGKAVNAIVAAGKLTKQDVVLEIGAGLGALTCELSLLTKQVIAVERDRRLIPLLKEILREATNVNIVPGDILDCLAFVFLKQRSVTKIIGTAPYYLSHRLLRQLSRLERPVFSVLVLQREVVDEAVRNRPPFTAWAILLQHRFEAEAGPTFAPSAFWPQPQVRSRILILKPKTALPSLKQQRQLSLLLRAGFSRPRKLLVSNLKAVLRTDAKGVTNLLDRTHLSPLCRAQDLTLPDWLSIVDKSGEIAQNALK